MLEFFIVQNTVYIIKDDNYASLWKYFIKKGIKEGKLAIKLMEEFKSHVIMIYAIFIHGKDHMSKVMDEWKITKDDNKVNELLCLLSNTRHGNLIDELVFNEFTVQNVLYMIQVCLEVLRKVQYTRDHKLVREFLNENSDIKIIEL